MNMDIDAKIYPLSDEDRNETKTLYPLNL